MLFTRHQSSGSRLPLRIAVAPFLLALIVPLSDGHAQAVPKKTRLTKSDLARLASQELSPEDRLALLARFGRFVPTTPDDVDLLYQVLVTSVESIPSSAETKLLQLKRSPLLARSRSYLRSDSLNQARTAVKVILAANDRDALPELKKLAADREAGRLKFLAEEALARFQDPDFLSHLLSTEGERDGPTTSHLLSAYGSKGLERVLGRLEGENYRAEGTILHYLTHLKDPAAVPHLVSLFKKSSDEATKRAALASLCRINTRDCQPLLRKLWHDRLLETNQEVKAAVLWALWRFDQVEIEGFKKWVIDSLRGTDTIRIREASQMVTFFALDAGFQAKAAILLTRHLRSPDHGGAAAKALQALTGKRFQYARPSNERGLWAERILAGKPTAADLDLTPESVRASDKHDLAVLEKAKKHLLGRKDLTDAEKKSRLEANERTVKEGIAERKRLLETTAVNPWEEGVPIIEAENLVREFYGLHED